MGAGGAKPYPFLLGLAAGVVLVTTALPLVVVGSDDATATASAAGPVELDQGGTATGGRASVNTGRPSAESRSGVSSSEQPNGVAAQTTPATTTGDVRVGILLLNIGNIAKFGFGGGAGLSTEDQQKVWQALIDDVNAGGGVHGRQLQPIYETYDVLSPDDMRRACLALTRDANVFVVVDGGGYTGPSVLCVTKENRRPFLLSASSGVPDEYYRQSDELLFTLFQAGGRSMRNFVAELPRAGVSADAKIGILSDHYGGIKETPDQLHAALEDAGYAVAFRGDLSGDLQTGTTQIPVTVQQMRARGVTVVVNISNAVYATQFVQEASNQGWHPDYVSNDWNGGSTDFYFQNMPASFDGSHTVTITRVNEGRVGRPQPPADAACIRLASAAVGTQVQRDTDAYGMYVRLCSMTEILRRSLEATGPDLTVTAFSAAAQRVGRLELPGFGGGSYSPGRFDAGDHLRIIRWSAECKCQLPIDDFRPTRH